MKRLLITGAAGGLGRVARKRLGHLAEILRLSDIADLGPTQTHEEIVQCDLADEAAVMNMVKDCDAILHLGGISTEQPFSKIRDGNITGVYNLYEAARAHGHPRIFFASSNHAIGFYRQDETIDQTSPLRPDGLYGVSKCFGEAIAKLYHDKFGHESALVRIGSCYERPKDYRMLSTWLSYDDFISMVERVFKAPKLGCPVIWGVSNNDTSWWSNTHIDYLGWKAKDNSAIFADDFADDIPDTSDAMRIYQGGRFVDEPIHTDT